MNDLYGEINEGIGTGILVTTFVFALATKLLGRKPESDEEAEEAVNQLSDEEKREFAKQLVADTELKMARENPDEFVKAGLPKSKPAKNLGWNREDLGEIVKEELEAVLDEKRKKKKKKRKGGKKDGKGSSKKGYTLRDWFKGDGWVQTGGKYDGKPCAKQPGQKTKPYCRDPDDRAKMSKKERDKRAAKKRREDPNPERRGKAKNVRQKKTKRKSKKNEVLYMNLEQLIQEELEAVLDEKRKKKQQKGKKRAAKKAKRKKKSGKKDACYHKVKSRYKVWPSAYASGALVKCRRVGAKNWGNSKKESVEIDVQNAILEILNESHTKEDEETLKKMAKKLRGSSKLHADQAEELQDIIDRSPNDELDESHSEKDEETLEDIAGQLRKASKMHAGQAEKIEKIVDDSDDSELREEEEQITESPNCGCGNDPCDSYGKNGEKLVIMVKEEIEAVMKELQLSEQEMNPNTLEAKRLVDELGADVLLQLDNKDDGSFDDAIENAIKDYANFEKVRDEILTMIGAEVEVRGTSGADIHRQIKGGLEEKKKKKKKKSAKDRMKCNSSRRIRKGEPGYGKKKFVVKACEGGTEKIIRYGDANMEIKKDSPKRRKSFRARHNCKNPGSKLKARYWSCKKW